MNSQHWGHIDYFLAEQRQEQLVEDIIRGRREEVIVLCSHPPVVTLGRNGQKSDIGNWKGAVYQISRGGRATYHGPGQMVCYPLLNLKKRGQNIGALLTALESAGVETLKEYGIDGQGNPERGNSQKTGIWFQGKKIASIGLALKRWVSYHGLAFNLYRDPLAFTGINPCGLAPETMDSLEGVSGLKVERESFERIFMDRLILHLPVLTPSGQGERRVPVLSP